MSTIGLSPGFCNTLHHGNNCAVSPSDRQVFFPSDYPTSCLLGSVDVIDCLAQEDYQEMVCALQCVPLVVTVSCEPGLLGEPE